MRQNYKNFLSHKETAHNINARLRIFICQYKRYKKLHKRPLKILDIGCGKNPEIFGHIFKEDKYYACDYYDSINKKIYSYQQIDLNVEDICKKFLYEKFDVIFCGEVIEHLFSPDYLVVKIRKMMKANSILILSTPNLGYYMNRIMFLFGLSPFFLENSSEYKFGRIFKFLGNRNGTEGHIRLFTFNALREFLSYYHFDIIKIISSTGPWEFFLDRVVSKFSPSLSATNIFVLKKARCQSITKN